MRRNSNTKIKPSKPTAKPTGRNNTRSSNRNKQRGKYSKGREKEVEVNIDRDKLNDADLKYSAENDLEWYDRYHELLHGATNFTYPLTLGQDMHNLNQFEVANFGTGRTIPGITTLYFTPTIGYCSSPTDAPNDAARTQYVFQRYSNSRQATYEAPDLMMSYIAADSSAMYISMLKKIYGIIKNNPFQNAYYPLAFIESMGVSASDIIENLAQFRTDVNMLCYRFNRLAIPADVYYFRRHQWMVAGMYLDSDTPTAQTYHFHPTHFYKWVEGETEGANNLTLVTPYTAGGLATRGGVSAGANAPRLTAAQLIAFGNSLLDALLASETVVQNISGDILKSYGGENLLFLPMIDETFTILPSFSKEVLSEIENAMFIEANPGGLHLDITQSTDIGSGHLICTPSVSKSITGSTTDNAQVSSLLSIVMGANEQLLNMHIAAPTDGDNMIATRFMFSLSELQVGSASGQITATAKITGLGSELLTAMYVTGINPTNTAATEYANFVRVPVPSNSTIQALAKTNADTVGLIEIQQFDWHPRSAVFSASSLTAADGLINVAEFYGDTRDIDNYTIIGPAKIRGAHNVALLSMFDSPKAYQMTQQPYKR